MANLETISYQFQVSKLPYRRIFKDPPKDTNMITKREMWMIRALKNEGLSTSENVRKLGFNRKTVRKYLRRDRNDFEAL